MIHLFLSLLLVPLIQAIPECFNEVPGRVLSGSSILILDELSLPQCRTACLELEKERCRSFSYSTKNGLCQLNSKDRSGGGRLDISLGDTSYFERFCYDKPSVAILRDESLFIDNCYEQTKGKILIGIVDQLIQDIDTIELCQKACQKSQERFEVVCKSAAYYEKEKECILASQSRHDIPDLFIDDDNAVYIENVCLGPKPMRQNEVKKVEINKNKKNTVNSQSVGDTDKLSENTKLSLGKILTSKNPLLRATTVAPLEQSGYDSPSNDILDHKQEAMLASTPISIPSIDPKVVDSYAVEVSSTSIAPEAAVVQTLKSSSSYSRRLKDERIRTCFTEVKPARRFEESRISKAYSLEQCTDICRLCWRCLRGKKCQSVAYNSEKEICALSLSPLIDGGSGDSNFLYHNRGEC
ncbi:unnamed protein product [Auanema sp. JU1783]|nr:unnamed protein product [Auanema sp. JU1783]